VFEFNKSNLQTSKQIFVLLKLIVAHRILYFKYFLIVQDFLIKIMKVKLNIIIIKLDIESFSPIDFHNIANINIVIQ